MLRRVIIIQNIIFDKDTLYSKEFEQVVGQLLKITRQVVKLIKEEEIQDAGSIFKNNRL